MVDIPLIHTCKREAVQDRAPAFPLMQTRKAQGLKEKPASSRMAAMSLLRQSLYLLFLFLSVSLPSPAVISAHPFLDRERPIRWSRIFRKPCAAPGHP
ncbi:hypothetical protein C1O51_11340 [Akkermansia muciniphila]|nr:hypothetical protein [Akkermansia muciniphila]QAA53720.1 hypothetical protein C1O50_11365 [Akkermansia muciniphila]QAA56028.1 hypothetical protein C1O51_11340 [Akkermansia muciniphila]QAA58343.1 hypothetical protein C1O54_11335 [Akkermansia muciniphila]QAA60684.1 hypothetical protein C1O57_11415 [Akkermansia muciniphila]